MCLIFRSFILIGLSVFIIGCGGFLKKDKKNDDDEKTDLVTAQECFDKGLTLKDDKSGCKRPSPQECQKREQIFKDEKCQTVDPTYNTFNARYIKYGNDNGSLFESWNSTIDGVQIKLKSRYTTKNEVISNLQADEVKRERVTVPAGTFISVYVRYGKLENWYADFNGVTVLIKFLTTNGKDPQVVRELSEVREKSITTKAGKFNAVYLKFQSSNGVSESWNTVIDGVPIDIKYQVTTSKEGKISFFRELIEIKKESVLEPAGAFNFIYTKYNHSDDSMPQLCHFVVEGVTFTIDLDDDKKLLESSEESLTIQSI